MLERRLIPIFLDFKYFSIEEDFLSKENNTRGGFKDKAAKEFTVLPNITPSLFIVMIVTPVVNFDNGSMVWDLAMKDLSQLNNPPTPDRTQWCNNTAYTQWLPYEIENGDAWDHLKQRYD